MDTAEPPDVVGTQDSTRRLMDTLAQLEPDQLADASLLPGWTRGHVVAHLALNGEGLLRALRSLSTDEVASIYDSDEARDADIEALATCAPERLRARIATTSREAAALFRGLSEADLDREVPRVPGGPTLLVGDIPLARRREVEIHHADLGLGYTYDDWPPDFCSALLDAVTIDQAGAGPFTVCAEDIDGEWAVGAQGGRHSVIGSAGALGWWLTGRGKGEGLRTAGGPLPTLGAWRKAPAR